MYSCTGIYNTCTWVVVHVRVHLYGTVRTGTCTQVPEYSGSTERSLTRYKLRRILQYSRILLHNYCVHMYSCTGSCAVLWLSGLPGTQLPYCTYCMYCSNGPISS